MTARDTEHHGTHRFTGNVQFPEGTIPTRDEHIASDGGYELTGGFTDRTTGTAGASALGSNVSYTQAMADAGTWLRFGLDASQQETNDSPYWSDPTPGPHEGIGLFGGGYMPAGVDSLFDYGYSGPFSAADASGELQYTAADGSLNFTQCRAGDLLICRLDINILPQIANTTVELALIWQTRDASDAATFTFALTTQPVPFGAGTVGRTYLNRPIFTAYFASNEDVNARALPAIRSDNPIQVQPLTLFPIIVR